MSSIAQRRTSLVTTAIVVLLALLLTASIVGGVWVHRDGGWIRDMPKRCWVVAVRREGTPGLLDLYEPAREMTLRALQALNAEYPGQFEWDYGRPGGGGCTWPDYGCSMCVFSRSREGALPPPTVVLQKCLQVLKGAPGPWRIAVRDDQGQLAGPARITLP
jgi:hypothetical protein